MTADLNRLLLWLFRQQYPDTKRKAAAIISHLLHSKA
jgi:hypothetical protein